MEQQAREQAFISALTTEQFVLQAARSANVGEMTGRGTVYMGAVSSSLIALGFLAQVVTHLDPFVAAVLPAVFVLGEFTFAALLRNTLENLVLLRQMQRIRGYYSTSSRAPTTLDVDGIFGPNTEAAVRDFQQNENLSVDGIVGKQTWTALLRHWLLSPSPASWLPRRQRDRTRPPWPAPSSPPWPAPSSPAWPSPSRHWSLIRPWLRSRATKQRARPAGDQLAEVTWNAPHTPTITGLTENGTAQLLFRARRSLESTLAARA
jgi:hypothetical protein